MKNRNSIEHDMQVQLINDCNVLFGYKYKELLVETEKKGFVAPIFSIPNASKGGVKTILWLIAEGLKSGVPDLFLAVPNNMYHGLFIELKQGKNKPSINQSFWLKYLSKVGFKTAVCYSKSDAINLIIEYMKGYKKS